MKTWNFEKEFVCPHCKAFLTPKVSKGKCPKCKFPYQKKDGIWHLLYIPKTKGQALHEQFDSMHKKYSHGPNDGSYEILASIARGNKTVDIACGEGQIEKILPETVGVEFSLNALKKAKASGAKNLVLADAHYLPFRNDSFDLAICAGSFEHFANPQKAILEMARVSKIQVLTVHREFNFPFAHYFRNLTTTLLGAKNQPVERPIRWKEIEKMLEKAKLKIVFKGFWTLPVNFGKVFKPLPVFKNIPSCFFIITIKR